MHPRFIEVSSSRAIQLFLVSLLIISALGCATPSDEHNKETLNLSVDPDHDLRADFRPYFCEELVLQGNGADCESELWHFQDEFNSGELNRDRLSAQTLQPLYVLVGGAFSGCLGPSSEVWPESDTLLKELGIDFFRLPLSSRSSTDQNAATIANTITAYDDSARPIIIVAHSKGAIDTIHAISRSATLSRRVEAIVAVASPLTGSHLANQFASSYEALFTDAFTNFCDPGDGGVLASLKSDATADLPAIIAHHPNIRFYSLLAWPSRARLTYALSAVSQYLGATYKRNDGQVGLEEAILPNMYLLGLVNADHWGVAAALDKEKGGLLGTGQDDFFPRNAALMAILRFVSEDAQSNKH